MSRHRDHLIRECRINDARIASLEAKLRNRETTIEKITRECWTLQARLAAIESRDKDRTIDPSASFERAVAQLRQMFLGMEIEVTAKEKEAT